MADRHFEAFSPAPWISAVWCQMVSCSLLKGNTSHDLFIRKKQRFPDGVLVWHIRTCCKMQLHFDDLRTLWYRSSFVVGWFFSYPRCSDIRGGFFEWRTFMTWFKARCFEHINYIYIYTSYISFGYYCCCCYCYCSCYSCQGYCYCYFASATLRQIDSSQSSRCHPQFLFKPIISCARNNKTPSFGNNIYALVPCICTCFNMILLDVYNGLLMLYWIHFFVSIQWDDSLVMYFTINTLKKHMFAKWIYVLMGLVTRNGTDHLWSGIPLSCKSLTGMLVNWCPPNKHQVFHVCKNVHATAL